MKSFLIFMEVSLLNILMCTIISSQSLEHIDMLMEQRAYKEAEYMYEDLYIDNMLDSSFIYGYIDNLLIQYKIAEAKDVYNHWIENKRIGRDEDLYARIQEVNDRIRSGDIFKRVEQMPRFPGCEDLNESNRKMKKCAETKMIQYLYSNLKYPMVARENKVEGTVIIRFIVDSEGVLRDITLVKDIGEGCGEEALKVVESMNEMEERWRPGFQDGKPVSVYYTIPVRFRLHPKISTK